MNDKTNGNHIWLIILALCLTAAGGYALGRNSVPDTSTAQQQLAELNRASMERLIVEEGPIYVIGHCSPDSDTVCSAIAYARLLKLLGFDARPAVSGAINRETAYILQQAGAQIPEELIDASGLNIFLVDHSEYSQAVEGMADAHIVGILDHHGIGTVTTGHQVVYEARPIGATATIIWLDYLNYGLDIDRQTAHLLLGAVLSDTGYLTGGTTTQADRQAVKNLAELAEVSDVDAFYQKLHEESLSYEGMTAMEIIFSDYKEYEAGGFRFGIGLANSINEDKSRQLSSLLAADMEEAFASRNVDYMYASIGIRENGEKIDYIICANELSREVFTSAFPNYDEFDGTAYIFRNGGLGRKTRFVPVFTDYLNAHPHE